MKPVEAEDRAANSIRAGAIYFVIVFAAGFILGAIRVTFIVPRTGELLATLLELPWMLGASWLACRWVVRRCKVPGRFESRLLMGASAFVLLMIAEFILSVWIFGDSPHVFLARLCDVAGLVGLGGQLAFALMPLLQRGGRR